MEKEITGYFSPGKIIETAAVLRNGGIAVLPTDTIYGFHCLASHAGAIGRIKRLKGSRRSPGFILLAADIKMVGHIVSGWPGDSYRILKKKWPAPLTALLPSSGMVPDILAPDSKIAVRIPDLDDLRKLISRAGGPIVSTSVNRSGERPMIRIRSIIKAFPGLDAYISQRGRPGSSPSAIVDFSDGDPKTLRAGKIGLSWSETSLKRRM